MSKYRHHLPQLDGGLFLTDGGLETTLVFHEGIDLPHFAAFALLRRESGRQAMRRYFERYIGIARTGGAGFILESPTWRANPDWGYRLGCSDLALAGFNRKALELMEELREAHESRAMPIVVSGCVGPRGDGYVAGKAMTPTEAEAYHGQQVRVLADSGADLVTGITMTNVPEAIGLVRAARRAGMPVVISFTVEIDGRLPSGQPLWEAISEVDAETGAAPAYFMINCAHPSHFADTLAEGGGAAQRLRGLRANASCLSHAELDAATELDIGDPADLGRQYESLLSRHPQINVLGGCCGTDHRHVEHIAEAGRRALRKAA